MAAEALVTLRRFQTLQSPEVSITNAEPGVPDTDKRAIPSCSVMLSILGGRLVWARHEHVSHARVPIIMTNAVNILADFIVIPL